MSEDDSSVTAAAEKLRTVHLYGYHSSLSKRLRSKSVTLLRLEQCWKLDQARTEKRTKFEMSGLLFDLSEMTIQTTSKVPQISELVLRSHGVGVYQESGPSVSFICGDSRTVDLPIVNDDTLDPSDDSSIESAFSDGSTVKFTLLSSNGKEFFAGNLESPSSETPAAVTEDEKESKTSPSSSLKTSSMEQKKDEMMNTIVEDDSSIISSDAVIVTHEQQLNQHNNNNNASLIGQRLCGEVVRLSDESGLICAWIQIDNAPKRNASLDRYYFTDPNTNVIWHPLLVEIIPESLPTQSWLSLNLGSVLDFTVSVKDSVVDDSSSVCSAIDNTHYMIAKDAWDASQDKLQFDSVVHKTLKPLNEFPLKSIGSVMVVPDSELKHGWIWQRSLNAMFKFDDRTRLSITNVGDFVIFDDHLSDKDSSIMIDECSMVYNYEGSGFDNGVFVRNEYLNGSVLSSAYLTGVPNDISVADLVDSLMDGWEKKQERMDRSVSQKMSDCVSVIGINQRGRIEGVGPITAPQRSFIVTDMRTRLSDVAFRVGFLPLFERIDTDRGRKTGMVVIKDHFVVILYCSHRVSSSSLSSRPQSGSFVPEYLLFDRIKSIPFHQFTDEVTLNLTKMNSNPSGPPRSTPIPAASPTQPVSGFEPSPMTKRDLRRMEGGIIEAMSRKFEDLQRNMQNMVEHLSESASVSGFAPSLQPLDEVVDFEPSAADSAEEDEEFKSDSESVLSYEHESLEVRITREIDSLGYGKHGLISAHPRHESVYELVSKELAQSHGWSDPGGTLKTQRNNEGLWKAQVRVGESIGRGKSAEYGFALAYAHRHALEKLSGVMGLDQGSPEESDLLSEINGLLRKQLTLKLERDWQPSPATVVSSPVSAVTAAAPALNGHPKSMVIQICTQHGRAPPQKAQFYSVGADHCRQWIAEINWGGTKYRAQSKKKKEAEHECFRQIYAQMCQK